MEKVTHRKIIRTLVDKFRAKRTSIGTGNEKERALCFTKEDLDRKGIEYNVPDRIEILPANHEISSGPDTFESILLEEEASQPSPPPKESEPSQNTSSSSSMNSDTKVEEDKVGRRMGRF